MNEGRLYHVKQQNAKLRRRMMLQNDHARARLEKQKLGIVREVTVVENKQSSMRKPIVNRLVDLKGYQSLLRQNTMLSLESNESNMYGKYVGSTYLDLKSSIREEIDRKNPRTKRLCKARTNLRNGIVDGHIITQAEAWHRFVARVDKPFPKFEWKGKETETDVSNTKKLRLPPIGVKKQHVSNQSKASKADCKELANLLYITRSHTAI